MERKNAPETLMRLTSTQAALAPQPVISFCQNWKPEASGGVSVGEDARTSAATPATSGEAIEVPDQTPVPLLGTLLMMPSPGAITLGQPRSDNDQTVSSVPLAPTEISPAAFSAAGYIFCSVPLLPAATTTTTGWAGGVIGFGSSFSIFLSSHASPTNCLSMSDWWTVARLMLITSAPSSVEGSPSVSSA